MIFCSEIYSETHVLTVEEARVFQPPSHLQVPDTPVSNSDSALSAPDSDDGSSSAESSSPTYAKESPEGEVQPQKPSLPQAAQSQKVHTLVWLYI